MNSKKKIKESTADLSFAEHKALSRIFMKRRLEEFKNKANTESQVVPLYKISKFLSSTKYQDQLTTYFITNEFNDFLKNSDSEDFMLYEYLTELTLTGLAAKNILKVLMAYCKTDNYSSSAYTDDHEPNVDVAKQLSDINEELKENDQIYEMLEEDNQLQISEEDEPIPQLHNMLECIPRQPITPPMNIKIYFLERWQVFQTMNDVIKAVYKNSFLPPALVTHIGSYTAEYTDNLFFKPQARHVNAMAKDAMALVMAENEQNLQI